MKNIFLSAFTALILIVPAKNFASEIEAEFKFQLSKEQFFNWVSQQLLSFKSQTIMNDFHYDNYAFPDTGITLQNLNAHIEGQITDVQPANHDWRANLLVNQLKLNLHVDEIQLKKTVVVDQPGFHGRFLIEAKCQNINIALIGSLQAQIQIQNLSNNVSLSLENIDWQTYPSSVQSSIMSCQGTQGFDSIIQNEINNYLVMKVSYFKTSLEKYLKEKISFYQSWKKLENADSKVVYLILVDQIAIDSNSSQVHGFLHAQFNDGITTDTQHFKLNSNESYSLSANPVLKIPSQFLAKLAQLNLKTQIAGTQYKSSDISAFNSLMHSRFFQFFIWPDLMNYSKKSVFLIKPHPVSEPTLKMNNKMWNINWNLPVELWGSRDQVYQKVFSLNSDLSGQVEFVQDKNKLYLKSNIKSTQYKIIWDQDYVRKYSPSQRIAKTLLFDGVSKMLEQNQLNWEVPVLNILPQLKLKPLTPQLVNEDYNFEFQILP